MNPKQARDRLDGLWRRGLECLGTRFVCAIMGGAMTWVSERHLVAALSNGGGFGVIANGAMAPDQLTAFGFSQAWSVVRRDAGPSQGPRDDSVRTRKAARRVAFRGLRRAYAPLDDVETSPARRLLPGGREKTIICRTLL